MIDYELYEEDEVLKPRHIAKKPRTKKADHKHVYETEERDAIFSAFHRMIVEVCTICGREGEFKMIRKAG